jgi:1-acyl-sn-glycerol-3-phosphate acyltransferase
MKLLRYVVGPYVRLFYRPSFRGWEKLPSHRPCLLVANHSGGGVADVLCFAWLLFVRRLVDRRPLTGLCHPVAFLIPVVGWVMRGLGAVPSTRTAALDALRNGVTVLVFPGGDHEAFRPFWQASTVDFGGRKGFLRLARAAWVPIVPLGIRGSHLTVPVLWRSRALPYLSVFWRLVAVKRLPVTLLWLAGAIAIVAWLPPAHGYVETVAGLLLWSICPLPYFFPVVPATVSMQCGDAISPESLFASPADDADLDDSYERVRGAVQALVS